MTELRNYGIQLLATTCNEMPLCSNGIFACHMTSKAPSILVLLSRFPYPLEKGDKLRAFQHLQFLAEHGYAVHLVALSDVPVQYDHKKMVEPLCASVHVLPLTWFSIALGVMQSVFKRLPLQVAYFTNSECIAKVVAIARAVQPDMIFAQLIRTAEYARALTPIAPVVMDLQDAFSKGTQQRIGKAGFITRWMYRRELALVRNYEQQVLRWFSSYMVISEQDKGEFNAPPNVSIEILPNAIDTVFFSPRDTVKSADVVFVGNMQYPPNVDAAERLVHNVMPIVWQSFPNATVVLAGATPSRAVRKLASERVTVTGWVDDIRQCYASARIFAAPMFIGTGLQNKLLEAMAMGLPCVTTPLSATPLHATHGQSVIVCETEQQMAQAIVNLLSNENACTSIGRAAQLHVQRAFGAAETSAKFDACIRRVLSMPVAR